MQNPYGLAFDSSGNLYVANGSLNNIAKVTPAGVVSTFASGFSQPQQIAFDASGNLYVANGNGFTISKVTPDGVVSTYASGTTYNLVAVAFDASGNLYAASYGSNSISKVGPGGGTLSPFVTSGLNGPGSLVVDPHGNLYVSNLGNNTISTVTPGGTVAPFVTSGLAVPYGLALDASGILYVTNYTTNTVSKVSPAVVATSQVTIQSSVESRPMSIGGSNNSAVAGINLTSAELAQIVTSSSGTVTIGDSSQTGNITFSGATSATTVGAATDVVQFPGGSGQIILDNSNGTALNGNGGTISVTAGTGGIVEAGTNTPGTADIGNASAVSLTAAGAIGTNSQAVQLGSTNLTTNTSANNSNQSLDALSPVTITSLNAGTGTIYLTGGTFNLSGSNQVNGGSTLQVDAGTFGISTFNDTVAQLIVNGGTVSGTAGVLTSTAAIDARSGSVSAILAGTNGLTKTTAGTLTLSGANTYTGVTTVSGGACPSEAMPTWVPLPEPPWRAASSSTAALWRRRGHSPSTATAASPWGRPAAAALAPSTLPAATRSPMAASSPTTAAARAR